MARASAVEWSRRVRRWRKSGLSAKEYAAKVGLNASTLTYWSWRLNAEERAKVEEATASDHVGALVELEITPVATSAPIEITFAGMEVRVPSGADEGTLAMVVRVLEATR